MTDRERLASERDALKDVPCDDCFGTYDAHESGCRTAVFDALKSALENTIKNAHETARMLKDENERLKTTLCEVAAERDLLKLSREHWRKLEMNASALLAQAEMALDGFADPTGLSERHGHGCACYRANEKWVHCLAHMSLNEALAAIRASRGEEGGENG